MVNDDGGVNEVPSGFLFQHLQVKDGGKKQMKEIVKESLAYDYAEVIKEVL